MRFALSDEQALIADTVKRMLEESFDREALFGFVREGAIRPAWRELIGSSGLLGTCATQEADGLGLGAVDALAIAREAGAHAVPFPICEGIVAAAALASRPDLAREVVAGRTIAVALGAEAGIEGIGQAGGARLSGHVSGRAWGAEADVLIIDARFEDGATRRCLVAADADGLRAEPRRSIDLTAPAASLTLRAVPAEIMSDADDRGETLRTLLACAEMEGAARTCLSLAVAYMKERRQFGQEIGRFQALKHVAATDALQIESMSVANAYAAWAHDAAAPDAEEALHIAKAYASDAARTVAEDSIQCHGGIGFTWDYGLHFYLRRILRLAALHGTANAHRSALLDGLIAARTAEMEAL